MQIHMLLILTTSRNRKDSNDKNIRLFEKAKPNKPYLVNDDL